MHSPGSLKKYFLFNGMILLVLTFLVTACATAGIKPSSRKIFTPTPRRASTPSPKVKPTPTIKPNPTTDPQIAQIIMVDGQQKTLKAPLSITSSMKGAPPCGNITLNSIHLYNLVQIKRTMGGLLELQTAHANLVLMAGKTTLSGKGPAEKEMIKLAEIESIKFEGGTPDENLLGSQVLDFSFVCGQKIRIGNDNPNINGLWSSFKIALGLYDFTHLLRSVQFPDSFDFLSSKGESLSALKPEENSSFGGDTVFGYFFSYWKEVDSVKPVNELSKPKVPSALTGGSTWVIQNGENFSLSGTSLNLTGTSNEDELGLTVNLADLDGLKVNEKGAITMLSSSLSFEVRKGTLSGSLVDFPGTFTIPISEISGLSPKSTLPVSSTASPQGILLLSSGTSLKVNKLEFKGGQPTYGTYQVDSPQIEKSLCVSVGSLYYWVGWDWLLGHGFEQDGNEFSLHCLENGLCLSGSISPDVNLTFQNGPFQVTMALKDVRNSTPMTMPAPQAPLIHRYQTTITDTKGEEVKIRLGDLSYARYPATAWSGSYYKGEYPFRWFRDKGIYINQVSYHPLIPFDSLTRIEFPNDCVKPDCIVQLTGTDGNVTIAPLYPGADNKGTRHGPSTWSAQSEGLLGALDPGILVFVSFAQTRSIELKPVVNP